MIEILKFLLLLLRVVMSGVGCQVLNLKRILHQKKQAVLNYFKTA
jgi:hypothetical protein